MTPRAALYARYSSDLQSPSSIDDQLRGGRALVAQLGAQVVVEHADAAISGASVVGRPGLAALMADAQAGRIDLVVCESLDRLTRSGGDAWDIFDDLAACGVRIHTLSEGEVGEIHVGLKGTMNALFLKDLRVKVRRGLEGVIRAGRHSAVIPYGYRRRLVHEPASGERIKGLIEIDPDQAVVVRRVAAEYLAGSTGRMIAHRLNAEGVAAPRGAGWTADAILGREGVGRGLLRNPIYAGEILWNRQSRRKNRRTGQVTVHANAAGEVVRHAAPELAILDAATWAAVQARCAERGALVRRAGNPGAANAPKRLLSGLIACGACGGPMHTGGRERRYRCTTRFNKGASGGDGCTNGRTAKAEDVEAQVLERLRRDLLHPEAVEAFVQEYRAAQAADAGGRRGRRAQLERDLAETTRRAERLVDQVADAGLAGRAVAQKLAELEAARARLEADLAAELTKADVVTLHPQAPARYRQLVEDLAQALTTAGESTAHLEAARAALRQVIRRVRILPGEGRGEWSLEIEDDLTALLDRPGLLAKQA